MIKIQKANEIRSEAGTISINQKANEITTTLGNAKVVVSEDCIICEVRR
ncbi:hypothetical protein KPL26_03045 [Clostridium algidicarnis]|nr:hypothetical protein [Clostridium algidicarnis]MBU3195640.1 hypothetical protein [Clostridium algidicarnis]